MFSINIAALLALGYYVALLFFTIHAVVLAYHWLSFGANRGQSLLGIAIYLVGGAVLFLSLSLSLTQI